MISTESLTQKLSISSTSEPFVFFRFLKSFLTFSTETCFRDTLQFVLVTIIEQTVRLAEIFFIPSLLFLTFSIKKTNSLAEQLVFP